ncbi:CsgG/HfaB family protein [Spirochaetota bacterium]
MNNLKSTFILCMIMAIAFYEISGYGANKKKLEKKKIAVMNFSANNVPASYSKIVRNSIEISLYQTGDFQMLERERIDKVLSEHKISKVPSNDTSKAISIGKTLATDFIIVGSLDRIKEYKIAVRVVSVKQAKIVMAYSQTFSSAGDMDGTVEKIAKRIASDIRRYVRTGKITPRFYDFHDISIGASFVYVAPLRDFYDILNPGYGFNVEFTIDDIFLDNLIFGLEFGFCHFTGRKNSSDEAIFVNIMLSVYYRFKIFKSFYINPLFSFGPDFMTFKHGSGEGFDMDENTDKNVIEPMAKLGVIFGFIPIESLKLEFALKYGMIYEKDGVMDFISFQMGAFYIF